jgi:hypothetical protein
MNLPKIYRRFAVAIIGVLLVGLLPASALADGPETIEVQISGDSTTAGVALPVTVIAHHWDDPTHADLAYTGTVHFTSSDTTASADVGLPALPADVTITLGAGSAIAGSVTFEKVGSQTLTATDTVATEITGTSTPVVTVTPAAADHFVVNAPGSAVVGTAVPVTVTATDHYGNTDTNYTGTATLTSATDVTAAFEDPHALVAGEYVFTTGVTFDHAGATETVTATAGGVSGTSGAIDVAPGDQTITFALPSDLRLDQTPPALSATTTSPLAVSFVGNTPLVCTVSGTTITLLTHGTCTIEAQQAGNGDWNAATPVDRSFGVDLGNPVVSFTTPPPGGTLPTSVGAAAVADPNYTPGVSSTGPVSLPAITITLHGGSTVCTLSGGQVSFIGVGTCRIDASQTGNSDWNDAVTVTQTIDVVATGSATKLVITGPAIAVTTHAQTYTVTAQDSHDRTVANGYTGDVQITVSGGGSSDPTQATLTSGVGHFQVTFTSAGTQTVGAGDGTLSASLLPVTVTTFGPVYQFGVAGPASTAAETPQNYVVTAEDYWGTPVTNYAGAVRITSSDSAAILPGNSALASGTHTFSVSFMTAGTQSVTATVVDNPSVTGSQTGIAVTRVESTYHPIAPIRLLDTRNGNGLSGGPARMQARVPTLFWVGGRGGVSTDATAVTVNVTVVNPTVAGWVYLGPSAIVNPATFTVAFKAKDVTAYGSTIALSPAGSIHPGVIYGTLMTASGTTDLLLDVTGYFTPDNTGDTYHPLDTPVRILDTRVGNGLSKKFVASTPRQFQVRGRAGVPANAVAVTGNLTETNAQDTWAMYIGPTSQKSPLVSTMNFVKNQCRANSLTVMLSPSGTLWATYLSHPKKTIDVVFDVTGYYTADLTGYKYVPITPTTLVNTQTGVGIAGRIPANTYQQVPVVSHAGVPANAKGMTGIVSVVAQTNSWDIFVGAIPSNKPLTSVLNFLKGDNCSNGFTAGLSLAPQPVGTISFTYAAGAGNTTHLIVYVTGYFVP